MIPGICGNMPHGGPPGLEPPADPSGMARAMADRALLWEPGSEIAVRFLDGADQWGQAIRQAVQSIAPTWSDFANVRFRFASSGPAQITVRVTPGSGTSYGMYSCYLGTDCKAVVAQGQAAMNLIFHPSLASNREFMTSEFHRVILHEFGHCLSGDTLIDCPRDLEKYPRGIPIRELVGQQPWVYAWSGGKLVIRRASRVWLSKKSVPTVRVTLRPGRGRGGDRMYLPPLEIVGTPDHPVLLSDGVTWKNLGDLEAGDRLCSMYRQSNGERSTITWTGHPDRIREHVFVCQEVYGPRPAGHDAHHHNENKLDQGADNLGWKEEWQHHHDHGIGKKRSPESIAKTVAAHLGRQHTEESKAKMAAARIGTKQSPETIAKRADALRGKEQSPELVAKRIEAMRRFYESGGRSGMFGKTASDETRAKRSATMKATLERKRREAAERDEIVNHVVVCVNPAEAQDVYDMTVPGADCFVANGVVVHNSLGMIHEHMRPDRPIRWDLGALYNYCRESFGWGKATVDQQIVAEYQARRPGSMMGGAFDPHSIMMYAYPSGVATYADGSPFEAPNNAALTAGDKVLAAMLYPMPASSPDEAVLAPGVATSGRIAAAGQVGRYRFTADEAGDYSVEATAPAPVLLSLLSGRGDPAGRMMAAEGTTPKIGFHPLQVGKEYYVEVRAAKPTSGTGSFAVAVHPPSGRVATAKPPRKHTSWEDAFA